MALEFVDSTWLYNCLLYPVHELRMVKANPKQNMDKRPCTYYPECSLPGLSTLPTYRTYSRCKLILSMTGGNKLMIYAPRVPPDVVLVPTALICKFDDHQNNLFCNHCYKCWVFVPVLGSAVRTTKKYHVFFKPVHYLISNRVF